MSMPSESCAVLIDSDPAFAGSVRDAAERRGILLVHASGVSEGLSVLGCSRFRNSPPSHVIFDLDLPDGQGERVLEAAEREFPRTTVIGLSSKLDAFRACALLGRCTYLPRVGLTSEALVGALARSRTRSLHDFSHIHGLSAREEMVLLGIVDGLSVADTAGRLNCKPSTVKTYLQRMYIKTGRGSQTELLGLVVDWLTSWRPPD
jgi:DNA-binding NarL/FixJ family response regulator